MPVPGCRPRTAPRTAPGAAPRLPPCLPAPPRPVRCRRRMAGPSGGARRPLLPLLLCLRPPPPRSIPGPPRRTGGSAAAAAGPARLKGPEELPGPGLLRTFVWLFLRGYLLHTHRLQVRRGSPARGLRGAGRAREPGDPARVRGRVGVWEGCWGGGAPWWAAGRVLWVGNFVRRGVGARRGQGEMGSGWGEQPTSDGRELSGGGKVGERRGWAVGSTSAPWTNSAESDR